MSTIELAPLGFHSASVFLDGKRLFQSVPVHIEGTAVTARRSGGDTRVWEVVEVAKENMAWDVKDESGNLHRLVVQTGCGCSGMKQYNPDPGYSGALGHR